MAWCPKCDGNYQIVVSVKGSSEVMPVVSEKYNWKDEYIGYETSEISGVGIESLPRCSNCYSVLKFPNATSKKDYFYAEGELQIKHIRAINPSEPPLIGIGCAVMCVVATLLVGVIAYFISKSLSSAIFIGLLVAVGLGLFSRWQKHEDIKERKKYEDKIKRRERKLHELQSMEYSDENYERLCRRSNPEVEEGIEEEKLSEDEKEVVEEARRRGIDPREPLERWRQFKKEREERGKNRKEKWGF